MHETPEIKALINDVITIAEREGDFETPYLPEAKNWNPLYRAYDHVVLGEVRKTHEKQVYQKKEQFRAKIKTVLKKIDIGQVITSNDEIDIYSQICQSKKLIDIDRTSAGKIIKNLPFDEAPLEKLLEQPQLGKFVDYYSVIKSKIIQLNGETETTRSLLSALDNNSSMKEQLSRQDPTELKIKEIDTALSLIESNEENKFLPLIHLWKQDKKPQTGLTDSWDFLYDSDLKEKRTDIKDKLITAVTAYGIDNDFTNDLMRLHHDFCMIDDVPQGTIEEKMVSVLEYGRIYPKLVSLKEKQIQSAYLKQFKDVQAQKEKLKTQYEFDVEQHKANNEFTKDVEDLLKGTYKKDIEDLEAQLPEKYQRSNLTKGVITGIDIFVNTITTTGINFVAGRLSRGTINDVNVSLPSRTKEWLNKQAISWNARNARDNNDLPNTTVPQRPSYVPSAERPSEEYQQEAINKIESPFKRMLNITQEFTLESLETVTPQTLEALFETTFFMAKNQDLDIHERFKPFVKLIETMPRDNFRENGFMNEERLLKVTSLIKDALDLKRGDFASALIRPFITKLKEQNNQLLNGEGDISEKLREEFSEITENSVVLSNKPFDLNTVDKRNPLDTMWELMKTFHITEAEDDPEELKDIPLSGHLPEIVDNALNDLRKFELKATKRLIDLALLNNQVVTEDNSGQQHILKRNEAFNGRDKKFLSLLIAKSMRVINPNPLNDMIAKFLCLYEGGHFAEGGGFSDSVQDDHTVNLNVLERLVDLVQRGRTKDGEPTILQRLDQEPARHNEDYQENGRTRSRIKQGKCDFKDVYDECNGNLDAMRTRFNRFTPKPFTVRITPEMSKQREAKKATYASLGGNGNTPNPTSSLGGI